MANRDLKLVAHLMRRAGFGGTSDELRRNAERPYGEVVEELFNFSDVQLMPEDLVRRYHPEMSAQLAGGPPPYWLYRMVSTTRPLQEKIALFWHGIFATAYYKLTIGRVVHNQLSMFRQHGLGRLDSLLTELSRDPSMVIWLDNQDNRASEINENYGRELLELFSMGVGNYTEGDVKGCARAFTGWTVGNTEYSEVCARRNSIWPYGRLSWFFEYRPEDHDDGEKTVLGHTGRFNGNDVVELICHQPATARFIARHMYSFFVADEPPVPQWPYEPPRDPEAIDQLVEAYFETDHSIGGMLKELFNSEFFMSEDAWNARVKSPAELVAGVSRLTGEFNEPRQEIIARSGQMGFMGQRLINPPTVEGWTQGRGWIDTGNMVERINFAVERLGDYSQPGVKMIVDRVAAHGTGDSPTEDMVDVCLDEMGVVVVSPETHQALVRLAAGDNQTPDRCRENAEKMVRLVASTTEFQRA